MSFAIIIIEALVFALIFTVSIIAIYRGDKKYAPSSLFNYPEDIREEYFKTHERVNVSGKSKKVILTKSIAILVFVLILAMMAYIAGARTFSDGFWFGFLMMLWIGIYDTFFMDWVLFANLKTFRLEGTEHMDKAYHQKWFHLKGMLFPGTIFGLIVALLVGILMLANSEKMIEPIITPENEKTQEDSETALSAIREVLKDEEWVKENLWLQKTCFGDEVGEDPQTLSFRKVGKDKVIVETYAYEDTFGIACTLLTYQDGKVVTYGNPSVEQPAHPGHMGFAVVPDDELFVAGYMHMGYYDDTIYQIKENDMEKLIDFRSSEWDEEGNFLQNESGEPMVEYTITIGDQEEKGMTTFDEFEQRVIDYIGENEMEAIDIPLTDENVEEYVR